MTSSWNETLWRQLGAAIDMLENAIKACPDELWNDRDRQPEVWYLAFHTLFFLDLYLSPTLEGFAPPPPFTLDELDPDGVLPERPYTQAELLAYLEHGRRKGRATVVALDDESAGRPVDFAWLDGPTFGEFLLVNLRHVQHGAAQLNLILRQTGVAPPGWVKGTAAAIDDRG